VSDNPVKLFGSTTEFATFGNSALAYVRKVRTDDINSRFPKEDSLPEGLEMWGLFAADGNPIALSDERGELMLEADEMDLLTVQRQ